MLWIQDRGVSQHSIRDGTTSQYANRNSTSRFTGRRQADHSQLQSVLAVVNIVCRAGYMYSISKPDFKGNVARFRKGPPTPRRVGRIGSGVRFSAMFQKIPCLIWVGNGQDPASCGSDKVRIPV